MAALLQRPKSPMKLSSDSQPLWGRPSAQPLISNGSAPESSTSLRSGSRKRLFMDRQQSELEVEPKPTEDKDSASALTLKKRQRTNAWGTDTTNGFVPPVHEPNTLKQKRRADFDEAAASTKRPKQQPNSSSPQKLSNGAVPIGRIHRPPPIQTNGSSDKHHVTFAPTPEGSEPPQPRSPRGTKRERESTIAEENEDEVRADSGDESAGLPRARKRRGTVNGDKGDGGKANDNEVHAHGDGKGKAVKNNSSKSKDTGSPDRSLTSKKVNRAPGEEWGPPGMRFKMRHDGVILRGGMVRSMMPKYHMVGACVRSYGSYPRLIDFRVACRLYPLLKHPQSPCCD